MKTKAYMKEFNLALLHEELQELDGYITEVDLGDDAPVPGVPTKVAHYIIKEIPNGIALSIDNDLAFPNEIFIAAHDATKKSKSELDKEAKKQEKEAILAKLDLTEEQLRILLDE